MRLHVQGVEIDLLYSSEARPTLFSLFLANTMNVGDHTGLAYDLGTGGGVLAVALARLGVPRVIAVDRCAGACEMARENARRNGVESAVEVMHAEIEELAGAEEAELIVVNPPTLPDRPDVPGYADGGGPDGRNFLRALFRGLPAWLSSSGRAEIILSSLTMEADEFKRELDDSLQVAPAATIVAPFRSFYRDAYAPDAFDDFLGAGQAVAEESEHGRDLSELITVYHVRREPPPSVER